MSDLKMRRHVRASVDIPTVLSVLIPEETFQPVIHNARLKDLSERGALVALDALPEATYRSLLRTTRYCRLSISSEPGLPRKVIGRAVRVQSEPNGGYTLGLFFEDCPEPVVEQLRKYVEKVLPINGEAPFRP